MKKKQKKLENYDFGLSRKAAAAKAAQPLPKVDAEKVINELARLRSQIPFLKDKPPRKPDPSASDGRLDALSAEEFELMAIADTIRAFADDLHETIEEKRAEAMEMALEIYYNAVELSQQPEHADLIPHVKAMEEAFFRDYGHPPPPRPPKKVEPPTEEKLD